MHPPFLQKVLKGVSRSFFLTLWVLPSSVRTPTGLAYLFCRAADTIADSTLIPPSERLKYLELFRTQFMAPSISWETLTEIQCKVLEQNDASHERLLLTHLTDCFQLLEECSREDQERIRNLVPTLTNGMEMDLIRFPLENPLEPLPLSIEEELDQYCYYVAGVVGEFWTKMAIGHFPSLASWNEDEMCHQGVRFGKGLQMTNILKDLSKDLNRGRCYIPKTLLEKFGLKPRDLRDPCGLNRFRPLLKGLIRITLDHLDQGWKYIMAIPRREFRLRQACLWPHLFALKTLHEIYRSENLLNPDFTVKISRGEVYRTISKTALQGFSNRSLTQHYERLSEEIKTAIGLDPSS